MQQNMDFASKDEYELSGFDSEYAAAFTLMLSIFNRTELQYKLFVHRAEGKTTHLIPYS